MKKSGLVAAFALAAAFVLGGGVGYVAGHANAGSEAATGFRIGSTMPDGTIYAGYQPEIIRPMYTTPVDAPGTYTWDEAAAYCSSYEQGISGGNIWHLPTDGELNVLFANRAAIGGFNETGSFPAGFYWSSLPTGVMGTGSDNAQIETALDARFSNGFQSIDDKRFAISLRCVR